MLLFPNCKINIGLNIVGRRSDGYHDLETVFYPVYKLYDALEILSYPKDNSLNTDENRPTAGESPNNAAHSQLIPDTHRHGSQLPVDDPLFTVQGSQPVRYHFSGLQIDGNADSNLCLKAYYLLKKDFSELPPVDLCLHKAIPMGAGLGGGSADGAFTLQLLNQQFHLQLLTARLLDYALQLGSDCPFFIINKPCFAWGRGQMLKPLSLSFAGYSIIIVHPGIHVSTAAAFAGISPCQPASSLEELIVQPVETWRENIRNDFEKTVFQQYPVLSEIKTRFYDTGALYASMSGSGSAVYGIYKTDQLPAEKLYPRFFELHTTL